MSAPGRAADDIATRVLRVRDRMRRAAAAADRDPSEVLLVAVSKTFPAEAVADAAAAGISDAGENRATELAEKAAALGDRVTWHFVGSLQRNKVRHVVGTARLVQSIDRIELAEAVARRASSMGLTQDVLIEVNVSGEGSKTGVAPGGALRLALDVNRLEGLAVRGLMTVPPLTGDPEETRPHFRHLAALGRSLAERLPDAAELSMGMTNDFQVAIQEGATIVRLGRAIFGPRPERRA